MNFATFFTKTESLVAVDIGSTSIKLLEFDVTGEKPLLLTIGAIPLQGEVFNNHAISKNEMVAQQLTSLCDGKGIQEKRLVSVVPAPSAFTKKIQVPMMSMAELRNSISFEASNYIPHNIDAVRMDFHVIGEASKSQLDVLVVAVKNEIVDSLLDTIALAGMETAVIDVEYFALQNAFELNYPEFLDKTVAVISVGARYTAMNVCRGGKSLLTGDVSVGGKQFTDSLVDTLGISADEAELVKSGHPPASIPESVRQAASELLQKSVEVAATDINRQLSFLWNAVGADEGIDMIFVTGGGAQVPGFLEALSGKTGVEAHVLDPFVGIDVAGSVSAADLKRLAPVMGVGVGLGIRQVGDKINPEDEA